MLSTSPRRTAFRDPEPRPRPSAAARFVGLAGRTFVGAGVVLLLFTTYLLWGTGVYTGREQRRAAVELERNPLVDEARLTKGKIPAARPSAPPELGSALFSLRIPRIGVDTVVVNGVGRNELRKGPGLFPACGSGSQECVDDAKYPGEAGNVAVSGHRTTYGAPFFRLNELERGDVIDFVSGRVRYRYRVRDQQIVDPVAGFSVVEQHGLSEVTLTTCHPRFSAAQRLVVRGDYVGASLISPPPSSAAARAAPLSDAPAVVPPDVIVLAAVSVAGALGALALSSRYRRAAAYATVSLAVVAGLWTAVFPRFLALMPANF